MGRDGKWTGYNGTEKRTGHSEIERINELVILRQKRTGHKGMERLNVVVIVGPRG